MLKVISAPKVVPVSRNEFIPLLYMSVGFSLAMVVLRHIVTGQTLFYFLWWNLFLAALPLFFAHLFSVFSGWKKVLPFAGWLFFLPNSFYIIRDLFHLTTRVGIPLWYDLALILSFAWNGCILGFMSVRIIEKMISYRSRFREFVFVYSFMVLNAFGVYIGRYWRYNSWDIVRDPIDLSQDIIRVIVHPVRSAEVWGMTLSYAFMMTLFYLMVKKARSLFIA